jgi:hypothetical protein
MLGDRNESIGLAIGSPEEFNFIAELNQLPRLARLGFVRGCRFTLLE